MGLFDKDDYDDVNLESLDGLAYDELNQKLHEYNKAMANEDKDIILSLIHISEPTRRS